MHVYKLETRTDIRNIENTNISWWCNDIEGKIAESSESGAIIGRIYHVRFATFDLFRFIFATTPDAFLMDFL